jgi:hypothetical protein
VVTLDCFWPARSTACPPGCPGSRGCGDSCDEPRGYPSYDQVQSTAAEFELRRRAGRTPHRRHAFSGARRDGGQWIVFSEVLRASCHARSETSFRHGALILVDNSGVVDNPYRTPSACRVGPRATAMTTPRSSVLTTDCRECACETSASAATTPNRGRQAFGLLAAALDAAPPA